jgi:hypothetical protein
MTPTLGGSTLHWPSGEALPYAPGATLFYSTRLAVTLADPVLVARARAMTCVYREGFGRVVEGEYPTMSPSGIVSLTPAAPTNAPKATTKTPAATFACPDASGAEDICASLQLPRSMKDPCSDDHTATVASTNHCDHTAAVASTNHCDHTATVASTNHCDHTAAVASTNHCDHTAAVASTNHCDHTAAVASTTPSTSTRAVGDVFHSLENFAFDGAGPACDDDNDGSGSAQGAAAKALYRTDIDGNREFVHALVQQDGDGGSPYFFCHGLCLDHLEEVRALPPL